MISFLAHTAPNTFKARPNKGLTFQTFSPSLNQTAVQLDEAIFLALVAIYRQDKAVI